MITKEELLFHDKFGSDYVDEGFGVYCYCQKDGECSYEIGDSFSSEEELLELKKKSLEDNFDYVFEKVKNNKKLIYNPDYVY